VGNGLQGLVTVKEECRKGQDDLADQDTGPGVSTLGIAMPLEAPVERQVAFSTAGAASA